MKITEAEDLAVRICQTWPKAINADIWQETLADLDAGRAGTAYVRLRSTTPDPHGPTIATFMAQYNSLHTDRPEPRTNCEHCGISGWKDVTRLVDGERVLDGVMPCHCPNGDDRRGVHQRILDHNADELRRLGLHHDDDPRPPTPARNAA